MAAFAVRIRVSLAVARLRVGAAAAAHTHVTGLHRPGLRSCRVVKVGLDRRWRATEPIGDLRDRQASASLDHTVIRRRRSTGGHVPRSCERRRRPANRRRGFRTCCDSGYRGREHPGGNNADPARCGSPYLRGRSVADLEARSALRLVRGRSQPDAGAHFYSSRIFSSDFARTAHLRGRAIGELGDSTAGAG